MYNAHAYIDRVQGFVRLIFLFAVALFGSRFYLIAGGLKSGTHQILTHEPCESVLFLLALPKVNLTVLIS